ncbi:mediator of RNA polymerase II transcription subunit 4 [Trichomonascus vanleenenianus]|uniref:Med4p n=1 Tax=Trichomonascus vanleenenianus TaxID=2268995 RepID=UPI003EC97576
MSIPYSKVSTPVTGVTGYESQFQPSAMNTPKKPPVTAAAAAAAALGGAPVSGQKVDTLQRLTEFEELLNEFVESVSKFRPDTKVSAAFIAADDALSRSIEDLKKHQEYGREIDSLKEQNDRLDAQLNDLLIGLSDCRRELMALPSIEDGEADQSETTPQSREYINADELLKYATKITKFTRAPPGYNPHLHEHASFPWPTEDELRRGVMAEISLNPDQVAPKTPPPAKVTENGSAANGHSFVRRGSLVSYGERPVIDPSQAPSSNEPLQSPKLQPVLDLDLFDPDEDD